MLDSTTTAPLDDGLILRLPYNWRSTKAAWRSTSLTPLQVDETRGSTERWVNICRNKKTGQATPAFWLNRRLILTLLTLTSVVVLVQAWGVTEAPCNQKHLFGTSRYALLSSLYFLRPGWPCCRGPQEVGQEDGDLLKGWRHSYHISLGGVIYSQWRLEQQSCSELLGFAGLSNQSDVNTIILTGLSLHESWNRNVLSWQSLQNALKVSFFSSSPKFIWNQ